MDVVIDDLTEAEQEAKPCLPSKLIEDVVEGEGFQQLIIYIILLNTLFLASEFYDEPEYYKNITNIGNVVFTAIFAFEMVFKLMGLGFKKYMNDPFNIFDCLIVLMSLAEAGHPLPRDARDLPTADVIASRLLDIADDDERFATTHSIPDWLVLPLREAFSDDVDAVLRALAQGAAPAA